MGLLSTWDSPPRRVFFSFHYQRDVFRLHIVTKHWVTKGTNTAAGYFDGSLEEKAKTEGVAAVKRLINEGMEGSSVLCVIVGAETFTRRWVQYEIFRAISRGMGVFGVRVHGLQDPRTQTADVVGTDPFQVLGYGTKHGGDELWPMVYRNAWQCHDLADDPIRHSAAPYLPRDHTSFALGGRFKVYDWKLQNGYQNFQSWVAAAAREANR